MKRRILFITRNFPPLTGGMERLNYHAFEALSAGFETALLGPQGCAAHVLDRPVKSLPDGGSLQYVMRCCIEARRFARHWRPDLIIAGSGVMALPARIAAWRHDAATLTFVHGLDIIYPSRLYQMGLVPAIRRSDRVVANSANTARLAGAAGVAPARIEILHPGVALPERPLAAPLPELGFDLGRRRILLAVGRLVRRKGLPEFIRHALPEIVRQAPDLLLLVAGGASESAPLRRDGVVADLRRAVETAGMQAHVKMLGRVSDALLAQLFPAARLHVFPVLDRPGDVEGFGMVAIEAAAHGTPTVAFRVGGVPDAVRDGVTGALVEAGDYAAFSRAVLHWLEMPERAAVARRCIEYASGFSWEGYGRRLRAICGQLLAGRD